MTGGDHLADTGDVAAHRGPRGLGGFAIEHRIGQPVDGHDIAVVHEQHCQQPALARPADRYLRPVDHDRKRTQCPKLDHVAPWWLQKSTRGTIATLHVGRGNHVATPRTLPMSGGPIGENHFLPRTAAHRAGLVRGSVGVHPPVPGMILRITNRSDDHRVHPPIPGMILRITNRSDDHRVHPPIPGMILRITNRSDDHRVHPPIPGMILRITDGCGRFRRSPTRSDHGQRTGGDECCDDEHPSQPVMTGRGLQRRTFGVDGRLRPIKDAGGARCGMFD